MQQSSTSIPFILYHFLIFWKFLFGGSFETSCSYWKINNISGSRTLKKLECFSQNDQKGLELVKLAEYILRIFLFFF